LVENQRNPSHRESLLNHLHKTTPEEDSTQAMHGRLIRPFQLTQFVHGHRTEQHLLINQIALLTITGFTTVDVIIVTKLDTLTEDALKLLITKNNKFMSVKLISGQNKKKM
jgi:hypothetical protein